MKQEPPFAIQVELVEGCNLYCEFCGLRGIRAEKDRMKLKLMEPRTIERLAHELVRLKWNARIEFAMHGEPTLHPELLKMVGTLAALVRNPIMITSNGGGLWTGDGPQGVLRLRQLFDAGLHTFALDEYVRQPMGPRLRKDMESCAALEMAGVSVMEYPREGDKASPHTRVKGKRFIFVEDISKAKKGTHSTLNNHCGAGAPLHDGYSGRCAKPFRELAVRWDGNVAVCCNDWRGQLPIASINELPLDEVWNHPRFQSVRKFLFHGRREITPCRGCNAVSYRVGLLPDKKGKETLSEPNDTDHERLLSALEEGPLTAPIQRPWEK